MSDSQSGTNWALRLNRPKRVEIVNLSPKSRQAQTARNSNPDRILNGELRNMNRALSQDRHERVEIVNLSPKGRQAQKPRYSISDRILNGEVRNMNRALSQDRHERNKIVRSSQVQTSRNSNPDRILNGELPNMNRTQNPFRHECDKMAGPSPKYRIQRIASLSPIREDVEIPINSNSGHNSKTNNEQNEQENDRTTPWKVGLCFAGGFILIIGILLLVITAIYYPNRTQTRTAPRSFNHGNTKRFSNPRGL